MWQRTVIKTAPENTTSISLQIKINTQRASRLRVGTIYARYVKQILGIWIAADENNQSRSDSEM